MENIFGTDGVRGEVGKEITPELAYRLARAAGDQLLKQSDRTGRARTVVIGRDSRLSGPMLEAAMAAGFMSVGVHVISVGLIPTPAVAYLVRAYHALAGVVISASHNPYQDNGIKFFNHKGRKLDDDLELEVSAKVREPAQIQNAAAEDIGSYLREDTGVEIYAEKLKQMAQFNTPFKLVVDCANGSASIMAEKLFQDLGCRVTMLADKPDGMNINRLSGSTHPKALQDRVVAEGADLGLAFDGDADRCLAVDAHGGLIDGDHLMAIFALWLQEQGMLAQNSLVLTVMSNLGLKKAMEAAGIETIETQVGDRYVVEAMEEGAYNVGGEQSGHIILSDYNSTGDGLVTAIMLLNIMDDRQQSLAELAQAMTVYPQVLVNVPVKDKSAWAQDESIQAAIAQAEEDLAGRGRILVRASGTEMLLRVMVEGQDQASIESQAQSIADRIAERYGI